MKSSYFSASSIIEAGAIIEPNCFIGDNVLIKSGSHIKAFSYLENCIIGENSSIGPFAHLRQNANISQDCRIGNFVEVKNSNFGTNSKAAHLSYIGDSELGRGVNIGAGTITCNYDGKNKHKTTIEDNVFVGSNTALIAPVTVKNDALIAAGSVITKNVEANELAVARAKQVNLKEKNNLCLNQILSYILPRLEVFVQVSIGQLKLLKEPSKNMVVQFMLGMKLFIINML